MELPSEDDREVLQAELNDVFEALSVQKNVFKKRLNKFFHDAGRMQDRSLTNSGYKRSELFTLLSFSRLKHVTESWKKTSAAIDRIYERRDEFLSIIDGLMDDKFPIFSDSNNLMFIVRESEVLLPSSLSSGEKQLLILLGEALLQSNRKTIFVADEPEISLHVKWQEEIVDSIVRINPSVQLIIATHSPDIVGRRGNRVVDMSELVK